MKDKDTETNKICKYSAEPTVWGGVILKLRDLWGWISSV